MSFFTPFAFVKTAASADPAALFLAAAGITDTTTTNAITTLVSDLQAASLWDKLKVFYPFAGTSSTAQSLNLINPNTYQLTFSGTLTYSSLGLSGSADGYGDTGFYFTGSNLSVYISGSWGYYAQNSVAGGVYAPMGAVSSQRMTMFSFGGNIMDWGDTSSGTRLTGITENSGSFIMRTSKSGDDWTNYVYYNGSLANTSATFIDGNRSSLDVPMLIMKRTDGYNYEGALSSAFLGESLTDSEATTLDGIINDYQTALSRNVY